MAADEAAVEERAVPLEQELAFVHDVHVRPRAAEHDARVEVAQPLARGGGIGHFLLGGERHEELHDFAAAVLRREVREARLGARFARPGNVEGVVPLPMPGMMGEVVSTGLLVGGRADEKVLVEIAMQLPMFEAKCVHPSLPEAVRLPRQVWVDEIFKRPEFGVRRWQPLIEALFHGVGLFGAKRTGDRHAFASLSALALLTGTKNVHQLARVDGVRSGGDQGDRCVLSARSPDGADVHARVFRESPEVLGAQFEAGGAVRPPPVVDPRGSLEEGCKVGQRKRAVADGRRLAQLGEGTSGQGERVHSSIVDRRWVNASANRPAVSQSRRAGDMQLSP